MNAKAAGAMTTATLAWAAWLAVCPLIAAASPGPIELVAVAATYRAGALICHQLPGRSFHIAGVQLPVCARCAGLYAGAAAGAVVAMAWAWGRARARQALRVSLPRFRWVIITVGAATVALWAAEHLGLVVLSNLDRCVAAVPPGLAVGALVVLWAGGASFDDNPAASAIH